MGEIDYDGPFIDCWQCGGEGRTNNCWDGCCVDPDDIHCKVCSRRCDVCHGKGGWGYNPDYDEPSLPSHDGRAE